MFENLDVFRMSHAMSVHAATKQALSAQNMANADTPGFAARDLPAFSEILAEQSPGLGVKRTRSSHFHDTAAPFQMQVFERPAERDPNGNSVSLEIEMLHAVNAKRQHDRAISIYKTSLAVLRSAIGK